MPLCTSIYMYQTHYNSLSLSPHTDTHTHMCICIYIYMQTPKIIKTTMTITRCNVREYKQHRYTCRAGGFNVEASFMLPTTVASSCKLRFSGSAARAEITELRIKSSLEKNLRQKLTFWSHTWVMLFLLAMFCHFDGTFPTRSQV